MSSTKVINCDKKRRARGTSKDATRTHLNSKEKVKITYSNMDWMINNEKSDGGIARLQVEVGQTLVFFNIFF